tara:strand:- start:1483 stop:1689 length:207 start_codon:yes stop_codon:yes gene_type:complete
MKHVYKDYLMESQGNKYVMPISHYHNKLMQDIDDAEWMSDFERADRMADEEKQIREDIESGALWYPLF